MKKEIICGIYKITNPNGRVYIGKSINVYKTWCTRYKSCHCESQKALYRSLKKYGWEKHRFDIIETCKEEHLNYYEIYYIWFYETYRTPRGMNLTTGGEGASGHIWTDEMRKRHSENHIGKNLGEKNGMFGRGHTEETKALQKDIWAERKKSDAWNSESSKNKRREYSISGRSKTGQTIPMEVKQKISKKLKQIYSNKENHPMFGKHHSESSLEKTAGLISNTETGIFYLGLKKAAYSIDIHHSFLGMKLRGKRKNNTPFIYV